MKKDLAIFGGKKVINKKFKRFNTIDYNEIDAVTKILKSGILSDYIASPGKNFKGGKKVQEFEKKCQNYFKVKHAITVNSWTSGLIAAVGALDIEPGDEIIVSPWTMCASATAILHWNAIPVFVDIEYDTFNLDPKLVEEKITKKTKAIMSIDIFGHSGPIDELKKIANKHNLKIISDSAQSPGAKYKKKYAGTLTDIGGISLNYHKHIHTGEGGVLFTNNNRLANRMRLIRNHAEAVIKSNKVSNLNNMIGHNFRLGEIESAIGIEQLKKLRKIVYTKQKIAKILTKGLNGLHGLKTPIIKKNCSHSFYVYPIVLDIKAIGVKKQKIFQALKAEGLEGIQINFTNVHRLPMFQKKIAYGKKGFPWNLTDNSRKISYKKGICPVAEDLLDNSYLGFLMCSFELSMKDVNLVIQTFKKVWKNMIYLKK